MERYFLFKEHKLSTTSNGRFNTISVKNIDGYKQKSHLRIHTKSQGTPDSQNNIKHKSGGA